MKIAVGTKNKAKLAAVEAWARKEFGDDFVIEGISVESGIDDMPDTTSECIKGAKNRAMTCLAAVENADLGIGLEGGVETIDGQMYLCGWAAAVDKDGRVGIGNGGHVMVPNFIAKRIEHGEELGPIMHELHDRDIRNSEGAWGIFTNGKITRSESLCNSIKYAYARLDNSNLYE